MDLICENGRHALIDVARYVMDHGAHVAPRGMMTREVRHLSVQVQDPTDVLCTGINANQSTRVVAAEALQLIGGFSDPDFAVRNAPELARFTNDGGGFDGAYGPRLHVQYPNVVSRLREDPDSRQAIAVIWERADLLRPQSKDYPCTLILGFYIRDRRLEMDVTMRSNDVNWGFKNDLFQFTQLQLSLAQVLELRPGPYRHTAYSMHLYERDWEWVYELDSARADDAIADHPLGLTGRDAWEMMERARVIAQGGSATDGSERWYAAAIA